MSGFSTDRAYPFLPARKPWRRKFAVKARVIGNDAIENPMCELDATLCDLCAYFSFLLLNDSPRSEKDDRKTSRKVTLSKTSDDGGIYHYDVLVYSHYSSRSNLESSRDTGCQLCVLISQSYNVIEDGSQLVLCLYEDKKFALCTEKSLRAVMYTRPEFEFVLAPSLAECLEAPYQGTWKLPTSQWFENKSIEMAKRWYEDCSRHHRSCPRQASSLPKRLVDIDTSRGDDQGHIKLVETATLPSKVHVRYLALTYCWGGSSGITTTTENIQQMLKAIPQTAIPQTVRDAISVCRNFGLRFLWVDALCICQDDKVEWKREAENMADVYGGCEFAISALSSANASDGFFKKEHTEQSRVGEIEVDYGTFQASSKVWIRKRPRTTDIEIKMSPLSRRGWTLQEKLLAPAVLHFGYDQIMWECKKNFLISETGERSESTAIALRPSSIPSESSTLNTLTPIWDRIITEYSMRELTYVGDRLTAIAGIANRLRAVGIYRGRYVAGLWEDHLDSQLLWYNNFGYNLERRGGPDKSLPTWSWAYLNLPIVCDYLHEGAVDLFSKPKFDLQDGASHALGPNSRSNYCAVVLEGYIHELGQTVIGIDVTTITDSMGHTRCDGLPGRDSLLFLDEDLPARADYYCIRMRHERYNISVKDDRHVMEEVTDTETQSNCDTDIIEEVDNIIWYLLMRRADRHITAEEPPLEGVTMVRAGVLQLVDMPSSHFERPYPDSFCSSGRPLLTNARLAKIRLV